MQYRPFETGPGSHSQMHLVAGDRHPGCELDAGHLSQSLRAGQNRVDVEQTESPNLPFRPLHTERVGDAAAQHLIAAAQPEDPSALAVMGDEIDVPSLAAQRFEISDRSFRSRQNDERSVARQRLPRLDKDKLDPRLGAQRVEIVEIGDARQYWDGDADRRLLFALPFRGSLPLPARPHPSLPRLRGRV